MIVREGTGMFEPPETRQFRNSYLIPLGKTRFVNARDKKKGTLSESNCMPSFSKDNGIESVEQRISQTQINQNKQNTKESFRWGVWQKQRIGEQYTEALEQCLEFCTFTLTAWYGMVKITINSDFGTFHCRTKHCSYSLVSLW